jgi:biopolymer transport protein ExbD
MRRKLHTDHRQKDPDLLPVMNLVCLLIPFLLLTATFVQYATINVNAPRAVPAGGVVDPEDRPLNLTVLVTDRGFTISKRGEIVTQGAALLDASAAAGPTIPSTRAGVGIGYDYEKLTSMLRDIKEDHENETRIMVGAERNIDYETIVQVMDATREDDRGELFPSVTMLGGVM